VGLSDLEKSVVKATYDDELPPKEKHVVFLTECTSAYDMVTLLDRRFSVGKWNVVFKTLIVIHRLSIEGADRYMKDLATHHQTFNLHGFFDASLHAQDHQEFIIKYADYLTAKVYSYRLLGVSAERSPPSASKEWAKKLAGFHLVKTLPALSQQFDRLLLCAPYHAELSASSIPISAFQLLVKDAFRLYSVLTVLMLGVVDHYQELDAKQTRLILQCCLAFRQQNGRFKKWTMKLAELGFSHDKLFPELVPLPDALFEILREHIVSKGGVDPMQPRPAAAMQGSVVSPASSSSSPAETQRRVARTAAHASAPAAAPASAQPARRTATGTAAASPHVKTRRHGGARHHPYEEDEEEEEEEEDEEEDNDDGVDERDPMDSGDDEEDEPESVRQVRQQTASMSITNHPQQQHRHAHTRPTSRQTQQKEKDKRKKHKRHAQQEEEEEEEGQEVEVEEAEEEGVDEEDESDEEEEVDEAALAAERARKEEKRRRKEEKRAKKAAKRRKEEERRRRAEQEVEEEEAEDDEYEEGQECVEDEEEEEDEPVPPPVKPKKKKKSSRYEHESRACANTGEVDLLAMFSGPVPVRAPAAASASASTSSSSAAQLSPSAVASHSDPFGLYPTAPAAQPSHHARYNPDLANLQPLATIPPHLADTRSPIPGEESRGHSMQMPGDVYDVKSQQQQHKSRSPMDPFADLGPDLTKVSASTSKSKGRMR